MLRASVYGNTDPGLIRSNNEDAYIAQSIWDNNHWLLVVIDGLGGYEGGEVAASIAKTTILGAMEKYQDRDCLDAIMQSIADANNAIFYQRENSDNLSDMACVITAAVLDLSKKQLNVAHVGDTRLYLCDINGLVKLTHDHSFVGSLEDDGHITEEDAMKHPRRNLIDRIVGDELKEKDTPRFIEAAVFPVTKGSQYLLCSDGLSDMLTSADIQSVMQRHISAKRKVNQLISSANKRGGKDNITAIVAFISSEQDNINIGLRKSLTQGKKQKTKKKKEKDIRNDNSIYQDDVQNVEHDKGIGRYLWKVFFMLTLLLIIVFLFYLLIYTNL